MGRIKLTSTRNMDRAAWLEARRNSIGGSDAAGIIGLSRFSSPYTVWADKTGRLPETEENEAIRLGNDLEDYVARRWMEVTGKKVKRYQYIIENSDYPHSHANIDRAVIGERAGLECKTTSTLDVKQFNGVEFPEKYYAQCVHYLAITGYERWYLAVLVFGRGFYIYVLERDQAEIDALMAAETDFWERYVATDTPPMADGSKPTADALTTIYAESNGCRIELFDRASLLDDYLDLKAQEKQVKAMLTEIENTIKADMAEAEAATCERYAVSWKSQQQSRFDAKSFAKAHPEIDLAPYYKQITQRPFKVKVIETEDE